MFPIHDFSAVDRAFPANVRDFMPKYEDIPKEFTGWNHKYNKLFSDRFYNGLESIEFLPRDGVDEKKAWAHLNCIAGSWEPKHEHKEAAFAYLCDQWFADIDWKVAKREKKA